MLAAGEHIERVAEHLGTTVQTVTKYKEILDSGGVDMLKSLSVGGRKSVLDATARQWIADTVRQSPRLHGFETDRWSNSKLRDVIERKFGVRYSHVYVRQLTIDLGLIEHMRPRKAPVRQSPRVFDDDALAWIVATLHGSPRAHGFDAERWTYERLASVIERRFGVLYSRRYVWQIATHLNLGHMLTTIRK
ncbi:hypothetical protein R69608_05524 [Paraburkholderia nemoris]|nr:hypothetical protein R69608_05524 [Paraburkholderia nemoris]